VTFKVKIEPGGNQFTVEARESILDAGLRNGLNLPHNCSNGSCGSCRATLIEGQIKRLHHQDFVFTSREKRQHLFLPCCFGARSHLTIIIDQLTTPSDIPEQAIDARLSKIRKLNDLYLQLDVRTPRSRHLQFLAGQRARLTFGDCFTLVLPIASCPCNGMHLRFYLRMDDETRVPCLQEHLNHGNAITVQGPCGKFVLIEEAQRPLLFIAFNEGFAQISSLIDHAISLDPDQHIKLFWIATSGSGHFLSNYCHSWQDSLDNFEYTPVHTDSDKLSELSKEYSKILAKQPLDEFETYITAPARLEKQIRRLWQELNAPPEQLHFDRTDNPS
jgi:CDP-4-dehydro-6-deoxyglucose reductase